MDIYFSFYQLNPKAKANQLSDLKPKTGVFLRTEKSQFELADYFPHVALGDQEIQTFLDTFPDPNNSYHQSILRQLHIRKSPLPEVPFLNHQFWTDGSSVEAPVVKYKIMDIREEIPQEILKSKCGIRLDANGIFKGREIFKYLSRLDIQQIARIEYIEDPTLTMPWSDIPVPTAKDFIESHDYQTLIYKPNRGCFESRNENTIFSGYMGHPLGTIFAYRELVKFGNLNLYHGLLTPEIYQDAENLFEGDYSIGFKPNPKKVEEATTRLLDEHWTRLCTI